MRPRALASLAALIVLNSSIALAEVRYALTEIVPTNSGPTAAFGISNSGFVTGDYLQQGPAGGRPTPFRWSAATGFEELNLFFGDYSQGLDVNDAGQVLVKWRLAIRAQAYRVDGTVATNLGDFGALLTEGRSINNSGHVVGVSSVNQAGIPVSHAFLHDGEHMINLSPILGASSSRATAMNDLGQITGTMRNASGADLCFVYTPGAGVVEFSGFDPIALNNHGDIVGLQHEGGRWQSFLRSHIDGTLTEIAPELHETAVIDINDAGVMVGRFELTAGSQPGAFVYQHGVLEDLNDLIDPSLGWTLHQASAINDHGQIVGYGLHDPDGPGGADPIQRGFLLTPVPEPAAAAAIVMFAMGLNLRRIRRAGFSPHG